MLDFERILNTGMNPKDSLLSLEIETCYRSAPSLYCEVFRMPDGSGMLYWRTSLQFDNRIIQLIQHFGETYNIPKDRGIKEIFSDFQIRFLLKNIRGLIRHKRLVYQLRKCMWFIKL